MLGDYFKVMQIPLKQGRDFAAQDFDEKRHALASRTTRSCDSIFKMKIRSASASAGRATR